MIAEEKLEARLMDINLPKKVTLYHGTSLKDLKVINPKSVNIGTRLSDPRVSSFWTISKDNAIIWALDWVGEGLKIPYAHDPNRNIIYFINDAKDQVIEGLKQLPVYVYETEVDRKYVGRGQCDIGEYTVDIPVKVYKMYELYWDDVKKYIDFTNIETIDEYNKYSFQSPGFRPIHMLIYHDKRKVTRERRNIYNSLKD
jgi:hypothetical protein